MKAYLSPFVASLLTLATLFGGTASLSATQVGKDSNWGIHFDMDAFKESAIFEAVNAGKRDHMRKFLTSNLNFDPHKDLKSVTLYGNGQLNSVTVVIKGIFDRNKIESFIGDHEEHAVSTLGDHQCHSYIDFDKKRKHLAFADEGTLVISHAKDDLEAAIALVSGATEGRDIDVRAGTSGTVFATGFLNVSGLDLKRMKSSMLREIDYADYMWTTEDAGIRYSGVVDTKDAATAENLHAMANGFLAMARMQVADQPEKLAFLNDSLKLSLKENSVWMTTEVIDIDAIQNAIKQFWQRRSRPSKK